MIQQFQPQMPKYIMLVHIRGFDIKLMRLNYTIIFILHTHAVLVRHEKMTLGAGTCVVSFSIHTCTNAAYTRVGIAFIHI